MARWFGNAGVRIVRGLRRLIELGRGKGMLAERVRTVPALLERFGSTFSDFTAGFNEGQYVLWLGSGISRDGVPNVHVLLERVTEHLRSKIVNDDADCEYRAALSEVLRLASLGDLVAVLGPTKRCGP